MKKWGSLWGDFQIPRKKILEEHEKLYGAREIPPTWIFNAFGKTTFLYYEDVNDNGRFDKGIDRVVKDMIHTTPESEAEQARGKDESTGESHGCVHIRPSDREKMKTDGMLNPGTPFFVHRYTEQYKRP